MEAVMVHIGNDEDVQVCGIASCGKQAAYHVVKINCDESEEERFFCEQHGLEYATRGHLVISESA